MIKLIHIVAMELFAALLLFKTVLLWRRSNTLLQRYNHMIRVGSMVLFITGLAAGIYMYATYYHFHTPHWLQVKFMLILFSMTAGIIGNKTNNRYLLTTSVVINILIIIIANTKPA